MGNLVIGRKYTTKSDNKEIDFDFKVLDICKNKVVFEILADRTTLPFSNYSGVKCLNYDENSQFIRNSRQLI